MYRRAADMEEAGEGTGTEIGTGEAPHRHPGPPANIATGGELACAWESEERTDATGRERK